MPRRDDVYRITDARHSPSVDRDFRTKRYLISMAIRTSCFIGAVFVEGWLRWVMVFGALVLPYIAVVLANNPTEDPKVDIMPPLIIKDISELPTGHPDRSPG